MEEWFWIVLVIAVIAYSLSPTAQKNKKTQDSLKKSKSYRKSEKIVKDNNIFALVSFFVLLILGLGINLYGMGEGDMGMFVFGIILVLVSFIVPFIITSSGEAKDERKKIQKMFGEQEKEELYQEELIKEKARLQARKEHKKK